MHLGAASVDCVAGVELPDACGPLLGTNSSRTPNTVDVYSGSESAAQYLATDTGITAYVPSTLLYDAVIREGLRRNCSAVSFGTCTHDRGRVLNTGLILNKEGYGTQHSLNRIFTKNLLSENGGAPV